MAFTFMVFLVSSEAHVSACTQLMCMYLYITELIHHFSPSFSINYLIPCLFSLIPCSQMVAPELKKEIVQPVTDRFAYLSNSNKRDLTHRAVSTKYYVHEMLCKVQKTAFPQNFIQKQTSKSGLLGE